MKNLKGKLEIYLRDYEVDMKFLKVEDFTTTLPTALDWELAQTSLEREYVARATLEEIVKVIEKGLWRLD